MSDPVRVLGISGSFRQASFNTALLRTAIDLAPSGMEIEILEYRDLPFYDDDVRAKGYPEVVQRFRERIAGSDGLLIATPEYNYSVPGPLKNAIDWASRPPQQPFGGKPLGIMGASSGLGGTVRAQAHLRQIAATLDLHVLNKPEVYVRSAGDKIADERISDEPTRNIIGDFMIAFDAWVRRFRRA